MSVRDEFGFPDEEEISDPRLDSGTTPVEKPWEPGAQWLLAEVKALSLLEDNQEARLPPTNCWNWVPVMLRKASEPEKDIHLNQEALSQRRQFDRWYDQAEAQVGAFIRLFGFFQSAPKPSCWDEFVSAAHDLARTYGNWKNDGRIEWLPTAYKTSRTQDPTVPPDKDFVDALKYYVANMG